MRRCKTGRSQVRFIEFHIRIITNEILTYDPALVARGPPTEDNPEVEEAAMVGEMEHDIKDDENVGENLTIQTNLKESAPVTKSDEPAAESKSTEE
jgi:hypothetical protein